MINRGCLENALIQAKIPVYWFSGIFADMIPIFLTGMMGSGKTTTAKKLSYLLNTDYVDLDYLIAKSMDMTISEIFRVHGEEYFRQLEAKTLRQSALPGNVIISTGGGTPCFHHNHLFMKDKGVVVWLNPPVDILSARLVHGRHHRPLIADIQDKASMQDVILQIMAERRTFYAVHDIEENSRVVDFNVLADKIRQVVFEKEKINQNNENK